jgi:hypothetical protein
MPPQNAESAPLMRANKASWVIPGQSGAEAHAVQLRPGAARMIISTPPASQNPPAKGTDANAPIRIKGNKNAKARNMVRMTDPQSEQA